MEIRYKIDNSKIIHEQFGNEVVIVNLDTGSYYSTQDAGAAIWFLISQGASQADILRTISLQFSGAATEIERETRIFLDQLIQSELLAINSDISSENEAVSVTPVISSVPFSRPSLQKYTDLEQLLLLDPIHEVDEAGWPNVKNMNPRLHV